MDTLTFSVAPADSLLRRLRIRFFGTPANEIIAELRRDVDRERSRANAADQRLISLQLSLDMERERSAQMQAVWAAELEGARAQLRPLLEALEKHSATSLRSITIAGDIAKAVTSMKVAVVGDELPPPDHIRDNDVRRMEEYPERRTT